MLGVFEPEFIHSVARSKDAIYKGSVARPARSANGVELRRQDPIRAKGSHGSLLQWALSMYTWNNGQPLGLFVGTTPSLQPLYRHLHDAYPFVDDEPEDAGRAAVGESDFADDAWERHDSTLTGGDFSSDDDLIWGGFTVAWNAEDEGQYVGWRSDDE